MTGTLNTGNQSIVIPIDYSVVANPYPSAVDIGTRLNTTTNIGNTILGLGCQCLLLAGAYVTKLTSGGAEQSSHEWSICWEVQLLEPPSIL